MCRRSTSSPLFFLENRERGGRLSASFALATENDCLQSNMHIELLKATFVGFSDLFQVFVVVVEMIMKRKTMEHGAREKKESQCYIYELLLSASISYSKYYHYQCHIRVP